MLAGSSDRPVYPPLPTACRDAVNRRSGPEPAVSSCNKAPTIAVRDSLHYFSLNTLPSSQAIMRYMICLLFFSSIIV